ncbi:HepT-like ribonuclease domain-containing protein [Ekhidna sp.]|uniref:HepT-like ribonuclease domain-containing protein n=1 Tax=Ekhidna sp. TaxID=2608089 RepID=UPI003CCBF3C0
MEKDNIQIQLNRILDNITAVRKLTEQMSYQDFEQNEPAKETVYAQLQEIGQAAYEIENQTNESLTSNFDISVLSSLRNARYNMEAEIDHRNTWALIKGDLVTIGEEMEHSDVYVR